MTLARFYYCPKSVKYYMRGWREIGGEEPVALAKVAIR